MSNKTITAGLKALYEALNDGTEPYSPENREDAGDTIDALLEVLPYPTVDGLGDKMVKTVSLHGDRLKEEMAKYETDMGAGPASPSPGKTTTVMPEPNFNIPQPQTQPSTLLPIVMTDPFAIDLNGDGKISTLPITHGVRFDLNSNGLVERTAWLSSSDGQLVRDINGNAKIDNGLELFGAARLDGFSELSKLDANKDGIISSLDPEFGTLSIWQDLNENALTDAGELKSLEAMRVDYIDLSFTVNYGYDENNVYHQFNSSLRYSNGEKAFIETILLPVDNLNTISAPVHSGSGLIIPDQLLDLPNAKGYGNLYSLHETMALASGGALEELLRKFVASTSAQERQTLTEQIIYEWAGKSDVIEGMPGQVNARKKLTMEEFWGLSNANEGLIRSPNDVDSAFDTYSKIVFSQLMADSHAGHYLNMVTFTDTQPGTGNYARLIDYVFEELEAGNTGMIAGLTEFSKVLEGMDPYSNGYLSSFITELNVRITGLPLEDANVFIDMLEPVLRSGIDSLDGTQQDDALNGHAGNDLLQGLDGDDVIYGGYGNDQLRGGGGNDILQGGNGNDTIEGDAGNDLMFGGNGNDELAGGEGADVIDGGAGFNTLRGGNGDDLLSSDGGGALIDGDGADTYVYQAGGGNIIIRNTSWSVTPDDTLLLENLSKDDITLQRVGQDVLITVVADSGRVIIDDFFEPNQYSQLIHEIGRIVFEDGTILTASDIKSIVMKGTEGSDRLQGTAGNDYLDGGEGSDYIYGSGGDDVLEGGAGYNEVYGGDGNDILSSRGGGKLSDGSGSDVYIYSHGIESLSVTNYSLLSDDTLVLRGVDKDQVRLSRDGDNLFVLFNDSTHQVFLDRFFKADPQKNYFEISRFVFDDGTSWDSAYIKAAVQLGTPYADYIKGTESDDVLSGEGGNDYIIGANGDDTLYGGEGNDDLAGGDGNDKLFGGAGDDRLFGEAGDDSFYSSTGFDLFETGIGSDTVYIGLEDGNTRIANWSLDPTHSSIVEFAEGIFPEDLQLKKSVDLQIFIEHTMKTIVLQRYFELAEAQNIALRFSNGEVWDYARIQLELAKPPKGTSGDDSISGSSESEELFGLDGNDVIFAGGGNDYLNGGNGRDTLYGESGDDTFDGGPGDDILYGGGGFDTFTLNRNGGSDAVPDLGSPIRIFVGAGIDPSEVIVSLNMQLSIGIAGTNDKIRAFFAENPADAMGATEVVFADGTRWDRDDIILRAAMASDYDDYLTATDSGGKIDGLSGNDTLVGGRGNDQLYGSLGDDSLSGYAGNDSLIGGEGTDYLYGGEGDDYLDGGAGDDTYSDTEGKNTYVFGEGRDWISDPTQHATIELKNYALSDLSFSRETSNLVIRSADNLAQLNILNYFNSVQSPEYLELTFSDASQSTVYDVDLIRELTKFGTKAGTSDADLLSGDAGDDRFFGLAGNDTLRGGAGRDYLEGGVGDDYLSGDSGDDDLIGGEGINTIYYQRGDGADRIFLGGGNDTLVFGQNIVMGDLKFYESGDNLVVRVDNDVSQQVTVVDFYGSADNSFNGILLSDGASINQKQIMEHVIPEPKPWSGYLPQHTFLGSDGNDALYGSAGDDVLFGGAGQDVLSGGLGSDLYIIDGTSSYTTLHDAGGGSDTIEFYKLSASAVSNFYKKDSSFFLELYQGSTTIEMKEFFSDNDGLIETFRFIEGDMNGRNFLDMFGMGMGVGMV